MDLGLTEVLKPDALVFFAITALVAALSSFAVFIGCLTWFRRDQRRNRRRLLDVSNRGSRDGANIFFTGRDFTGSGELVAQFKVNDGQQVVSVLESEGRRFVHIDGTISAGQRARMIRYLKSEGFMS